MKMMMLSWYIFHHTPYQFKSGIKHFLFVWVSLVAWHLPFPPSHDIRKRRKWIAADGIVTNQTHSWWITVQTTPTPFPFPPRVFSCQESVIGAHVLQHHHRSGTTTREIFGILCFQTGMCRGMNVSINRGRILCPISLINVFSVCSS